MQGKTGMPIAVSGSPNEITEISVDVLQEHLSKPLLGAMLELHMEVHDYRGDVIDIMVLGQVNEVVTSNRWHENPSLKNHIKRRGQLPNLTRVTDVTTAKVQILGTYRGQAGVYQKERMTVPPGSGIPLNVVERSTILDIMSRETGIAYVGKIYGPGDLPAPVTLKDFGDAKNGGFGEAYMGGFFGPTGSGKTVIAATCDALWARQENMGLLILDPAGEFAQNAIARNSAFEFDFFSMLRASSNGRFNADRDVFNISEIRLEGFELFAALLERENFFRTIGLGSQEKRTAAIETVGDALDSLAGGKTWEIDDSLAALHADKPDVYERVKGTVIDACGLAYAGKTRDEFQKNFGKNWDDNLDLIHRLWDGVAKRFASIDDQGKERPDLTRIVRDVLSKGRKVIVDLSPGRLGIEEKYKLHLMHFAMRRIWAASQTAFKTNSPINCLIVLDEAGRFIPESTKSDERSAMSGYITERVKEMRKYGVGWQFITQTVSEIQKDIFRNLHYRVYGVGLSVGSEETHIKDKEGQEAFKMYSSLPDPKLSGIYSYMVCGGILALGTTGKPMYIEGYGSDVEIMEENNLRERFVEYKSLPVAVDAPTNGAIPTAQIETTR